MDLKSNFYGVGKFSRRLCLTHHSSIVENNFKSTGISLSDLVNIYLAILTTFL